MEMVGSQQGFLGWLSSLLFALHLFFLAYPMLLWARPDAGAIEQVLREEAGKGFTHEGYVRLTRDVRSREELEQALEGKEEQIFDVDHLRIHLGYGQDCFSRAKLAMMAWKMFTVPDWLEICWPHSTIREGETLGMLILNVGLYSLTACRIVYTIDEDSSRLAGDTVESGSIMAESDTPSHERFGFACGTLPCHLVSGEERFLVEWDKADDSVCYEVLSFSKPQHWMAKVGYPISRWYQEQYHKETGWAMLLSVSGEEGVEEPEDV